MITKSINSASKLMRPFVIIFFLIGFLLPVQSKAQFGDELNDSLPTLTFSNPIIDSGIVFSSLSTKGRMGLQNHYIYLKLKDNLQVILLQTKAMVKSAFPAKSLPQILPSR